MYNGYFDYLEKIDILNSFSITTSATMEDENFYVDGDVLREAEEIFKRYGRSYSGIYGARIPFDVWLQCLEEWKKECQSDKWLADFSKETLEILCEWTEMHKDGYEEVYLYDMLK